MLPSGSFEDDELLVAGFCAELSDFSSEHPTQASISTRVAKIIANDFFVFIIFYLQSVVFVIAVPKMLSTQPSVNKEATTSESVLNFQKNFLEC